MCVSRPVGLGPHTGSLDMQIRSHEISDSKSVDFKPKITFETVIHATSTSQLPISSEQATKLYKKEKTEEQIVRICGGEK